MAMFSGKTALITGSGAGIGRATALKFAAEGANVVVSDIHAAGGEETVAMIHKAGGRAMFQLADVSDSADVAALVAGAVDEYGRLDCAVNNAGIEGRIAPLGDQTEANYDAIMAINAKGTFLCLREEIRHMLAEGGGAIVNLSSVAGLIGFPGLSPYVASKHAVIGMTRNAALEYGKAGIRVNAVCPGGIDTRMLDSLADQATGGSRSSQQMMDPLHPIGHIGTPEEVANLIVWLCSPEASFMLGAVIPVDGGFVAQ
ncbi:NAD(P)-dependent dehydrogenase (short-subunit alcohol dehydrogenase family) [Hoeflea marina]|uniref:NAD(P)-dependent dehydrogenase (Short-subunit alcohol dehydrogenase family) n=1 Tax=Hoeflea marina TaxID=274592 RepID=A0A317PSR8_9HYPH|nr:glucose 1-dehydrogenase [Hoeflea marina]PWW03957.1 NAD(P)-dependent dehydrogenase (short-subunit alcohol dehydrogenase family) [Hoeflea marina]